MARTPEERRAADAERKRRARARAAEERERVARERRTADGSVAGTTMRDAVAQAVEHMRWLKPSDIASVTQAHSLAEKIDLLEHMGEDTKALSAHRALSRVLADLGGTPIVRMARELRSLRSQPGDAAEADESGEKTKEGGKVGKQAAGAIVSQFERPVPRRR